MAPPWHTTTTRPGGEAIDHTLDRFDDLVAVGHRIDAAT